MQTVKQMINAFIRQRQRRRRAYAAFTTLAILVSLTTMYTLSQPASTLAAEPVCGLEEHVHTDNCYTERLICGLEEQAGGEEAHVHDETCYVRREELVCGQEEAEAHTHGEGCRGLICGQTEYEAHTHDESCCTTVEETCGQEEYPAHTHGEGCHTTTRSLTCGEAESGGHSHDGSCWGVDGVLNCGQSEGAGHAHSEGCYTQSTQLTCAEREGPGHTHDEGCTTRRDVLTCAAKEGPGHVHDDGCYGLTCGKAETGGHTHTDACRETVEELACTAGHVHTASCYERVLTCEQAEHEHSSLCYEEVGEERPVPAESEYICGLEAHAHGEACLDEEGGLICGLEEHEHTGDCLSPEEEEPPADQFPGELPEGYDSYAFENGDGLSVLAYAPKDAFHTGVELFARQLTEDSADYAAARAALENSGDANYDGFVALDIRFVEAGTGDPAGAREVEPDPDAGRVYVKIEARALLPEDADESTLEVRHHKAARADGGIAVETVADRGGNGEIAASPARGREAEEDTGALDVTAAFGVDSFSTFTVTWNSLARERSGEQTGNMTVTKVFQDANGTVLKEPPVDLDHICLTVQEYYIPYGTDKEVNIGGPRTIRLDWNEARHAFAGTMTDVRYYTRFKIVAEALCGDTCAASGGGACRECHPVLTPGTDFTWNDDGDLTIDRNYQYAATEVKKVPEKNNTSFDVTGTGYVVVYSNQDHKAYLWMPYMNEITDANERKKIMDRLYQVGHDETSGGDAFNFKREQFEWLTNGLGSGICDLEER